MPPAMLFSFPDSSVTHIVLQCAETNFALVKIHQKGKVEQVAVVGSEGVYGHVIDLDWLEMGHIFFSRPFKTRYNIN